MCSIFWFLLFIFAGRVSAILGFQSSSVCFQTQKLFRGIIQWCDEELRSYINLHFWAVMAFGGCGSYPVGLSRKGSIIKVIIGQNWQVAAVPCFYVKSALGRLASVVLLINKILCIVLVFGSAFTRCLFFGLSSLPSTKKATLSTFWKKTRLQEFHFC